MNPRIKSGLILFQLAVAFGWAAGVVWFYFTIASVGEPVSPMVVLYYWVRLLVGPVLLFVGSFSLIPEGRHQPLMSVVALVGSIAVVFQALQAIAPVAWKSLQAGGYGFASLWAGMVGVSILSGVAGYKLYREARAPATPHVAHGL